MSIENEATGRGGGARKKPDENESCRAADACNAANLPRKKQNRSGAFFLRLFDGRLFFFRFSAE